MESTNCPCRSTQTAVWLSADIPCSRLPETSSFPHHVPYIPTQLLSCSTPNSCICQRSSWSISPYHITRTAPPLHMSMTTHAISHVPVITILLTQPCQLLTNNHTRTSVRGPQVCTMTTAQLACSGQPSQCNVRVCPVVPSRVEHTGHTQPSGVAGNTNSRGTDRNIDSALEQA